VRAAASALQQLDTRGSAIYSASSYLREAVRALSGHPCLQDLTLRESGTYMPWQGQPLQSLPRLRRLRVLGAGAPQLASLLQDAAGCAQLQELELELGKEWASAYEARSWAEAAAASWVAGLQALCSGACSASLCKLQVLAHRREVAPSQPEAVCRGAAAPAAAQVLLAVQQGRLPQLQELVLDVAVEVLPSSRGSADAMGGSGQQPTGGEAEQLLQAMQQLLLEHGVRGVETFRLAGSASSGVYAGAPCYSARLGQCCVRGMVQPWRWSWPSAPAD
jgi:hypothetical protein